jgi:putative tryptophan/tyrosine transport system substrate-binding protein
MAFWGSESAQAGFELFDLMVDHLDELEPKVGALASSGDAALFMGIDVTLFSWRTEIMSVAMRHRLPTACGQWLGWGQEGCLITYGEDPVYLNHRAAAQVVKIFNGTKPADIPIEQPTRFTLILNARTAKALGLTIPPSLLVMADEVIK